MAVTGVGEYNQNVVMMTEVSSGPSRCCGSHKGRLRADHQVVVVKRDRLRNTMCCDGYSGRLRVTLRAIKCRL